MPSRHSAISDGAIARVLLGPLQKLIALAFGLALLWLCACALYCLFVLMVWPHGLETLRALLVHELGQGAALVALQGEGPGALTALANALYAIAFEATGIHDMGTQFAIDGKLSIPDTILRRAYVSHRVGIEAAMMSTQLLGVRAGLLVRFAPLVLMLYVVGLADGLARRAVRRACAGHESAGLYHRAKCAQILVLGLGGSGLLVWPAQVRWGLCVPLAGTLIGCLASLQWTYYKKHL